MRLVLDGLTIGYERPLVSKLTAAFSKPSLIQVLGPNGSGKTTLLRTIAGLIRPLDGRVLVDDDDITGRPDIAGKYISMLPQMTSTVVNAFPMTLWEFLKYSRKLMNNGGSVISDEDIAKALELVDLPRNIWNLNIRKLSGGQRQKAFIARAILSNTPILLLDEPLSSIDPQSKIQISKLITKLSKTRLVIVTTHDPTLLMNATDNILLINNGWYFLGSVSDVMKVEVLKNVYNECVVPVDRCLHIVDAHA